MQSGPLTNPAPVFHLNTESLVKSLPIVGVPSVAARELGRRVPITPKHKSRVDGAHYNEAGEFVGGGFTAGGLRMHIQLIWRKDGTVGAVYGYVASEDDPMYPLFAIGYWAKPEYALPVWQRVFRHYINSVIFHLQKPEAIDGDAAVTMPELKECSLIATLNPMNVDGDAAVRCNLQAVKTLAESIVTVAHNYKLCGTPHWNKDDGIRKSSGGNQT